MSRRPKESGDGVDEGDLQQDRGAGQAQYAVRSGCRSLARIQGPAGSERQKQGPEQQQTQQHVPAHQHEGVAIVKRREEQPGADGDETGVPADTQGEGQDGRRCEQGDLERQGAVQPMEGVRAVAQRPAGLHREDAEVGVVGLEIQGPIGQIGEKQRRQAHAQGRQTADVDGEELGSSRRQPGSRGHPGRRSRASGGAPAGAP
jgi:hypothetical protein